MSSPSLPPLALIAGPTASGKSALALALAQSVGGTIINCDSMQVYRDLRVITARPSEEEEARAPHLLYGHVDGATAHSAAAWAGEARDAIASVHAAGGVPILTGGTGMYIRTLLDGIAPVPDIALDVRNTVRAMPLELAYTALCRHDVNAGQRLHANDDTRIRRALEVVLSTGRTLADWQATLVGGIGEKVTLHPLILAPPREWLAERGAARFEIMLRDGQDEVAALIARDLDPRLPVMRAIGVREIADLLSGKLSVMLSGVSGVAATRAYVKRQTTWFANQCPADWERIIAPLNAEIIDGLVIKLQKKLLTA